MKNGPHLSDSWGFGLNFGSHFGVKNRFWGSPFSDDFVDDLFNGFGRLLDLIFVVFGMPKHA